jgi:hypothetical protein
LACGTSTRKDLSAHPDAINCSRVLHPLNIVLCILLASPSQCLRRYMHCLIRVFFLLWVMSFVLSQYVAMPVTVFLKLCLRWWEGGDVIYYSIHRFEIINHFDFYRFIILVVLCI